MYTETSNKLKLIAFYLPQFHPIPENDKWWGKGFTEWTNVAKAKPLFKGHYQPHLPADLGFYDLRIPEVREAQALLARQHGLTGFCYWHYWFGDGKRLLERPFDEVLHSGDPDFPFCLAWANESWTGIWHGLKDKTLIKQMYPGKEDYVKHFNHLLKAFSDKRYIKIENKPVFIVYKPHQLPDPLRFTEIWNELAIRNSFDGIYFIGVHDTDWDHHASGFDDKTIHPIAQYQEISDRNKLQNPLRILKRIQNKGPFILNYEKIVKAWDFSKYNSVDLIPTIIPNWDNSPRSGKNSYIFYNSTPAAFGFHFKSAVNFVLNRNDSKPKILFIKSWNEWAEGNYLEPDQQWGKGHLENILHVLQEKNIDTAYNDGD